jgi:RNA polymerase sigma-70 factor (ECF subfamily)
MLSRQAEDKSRLSSPAEPPRRSSDAVSPGLRLRAQPVRTNAIAPLVEPEVEADTVADPEDPEDPEDIEVLHTEFSDFYRAHWSSLAQALTFAVGDRDLAVEVTDEAMARAYPRWRKLRGYDSPAAWVYRVGFNLAVSHRRRLARRLPWAQREASDPMPVTDPAIRTALLELAPQFRSVVVCRLLLDWSVDETARALGVRPSTVRTRLHRALQKLHVTLEHLR